MPGIPSTSIDLPASLQLRLTLDERRYKALAGAVTEAAMELRNETAIPNERPNEDWVARLVESASPVTDKNMQALWGRILAGEIKRPGSFSLRALDLVRNLSKTEAQLFEKVCNWVISTSEYSFVANVDQEWLQKNRGTYFLHFAELADVGLLFPNAVDITLFANE